MAGDVNTVVESYAEYLLLKQKKLWERFQRTRRNTPESAIAEAMVFRVLQACKVKPDVADKPNAGGPDFLCDGGVYGKFMVEATSFTPDKVTRDTALPNAAPDEITGQAFGLLTRQIDEKAADKRRQFDALSMPGILAIASSHFGASLVLDYMAAENALISQSFWTMNEERMSTDLASSIFLRLESDGEITTKNASISAVLFISVLGNQSHVCGALNPSAARPFRPEPLWMIPFIQLKDWPIENKKIRCIWTMGNQRTYPIAHESIRPNG